MLGVRGIYDGYNRENKKQSLFEFCYPMVKRRKPVYEQKY